MEWEREMHIKSKYTFTCRLKFLITRSGWQMKLMLLNAFRVFSTRSTVMLGGAGRRREKNSPAAKTSSLLPEIRTR